MLTGSPAHRFKEPITLSTGGFSYRSIKGLFLFCHSKKCIATKRSETKRGNECEVLLFIMRTVESHPFRSFHRSKRASCPQILCFVFMQNCLIIPANAALLVPFCSVSCSTAPHIIHLSCTNSHFAFCWCTCIPLLCLSVTTAFVFIQQENVYFY